MNTNNQTSRVAKINSGWAFTCIAFMILGFVAGHQGGYAQGFDKGTSMIISDVRSSPAVFKDELNANIFYTKVLHRKMQGN